MRRAPNASSAVRQQRAKKLQPADDPKTAIYRAIEYYPTPCWAARAGAEIAKEIWPHAKSVRESACGEGHMAEPFKDYFGEVVASDIHDHAYGQIGDFLAPGLALPKTDILMTNPPFSKALAFIRRGMEVSRLGVGIFARIALLEGEERFHDLYLGPNRLVMVAPFCERVSPVLGCWDPSASVPTCYAWFFFVKGTTTPVPGIRPIPPGTKARLTMPMDARRFGKISPAPLLASLAKAESSV